MVVIGKALHFFRSDFIDILTHLLCGTHQRCQAHPHPIAGTPTEVPVPSRIISPRKSVVLGVLDKEVVSREELEFAAPGVPAYGMKARY